MEWIKIGEILYNIWKGIGFKKGITARHNPLSWKDLNKINILSKMLVLDGYSVDFVFVILIHNGKKEYWSIVGGFVEDILMKKFKMRDYENLIIDEEHEKIFSEVEKLGEINREISDLGSGTMKDIWEFENIKFSKYFFIKKRDRGNKFKCIVKLGTSQKNEFFDLTYQKRSINIFINKVKTILQDY